MHAQAHADDVLHSPFPPVLFSIASRYNIPTKMLYDPAPYNDMGDPGHDMSKYMDYNNGAAERSRTVGCSRTARSATGSWAWSRWRRTWRMAPEGLAKAVDDDDSETGVSRRLAVGDGR